jgi:DedD protein
MSIYNKLDDEPERTDTEITLGLRSILGIFFGLVLICGVFFGFGYSFGRSNAVKPSAAPEVSTQSAAASPAPITTVVEQPASPTKTNDPYNFNTNNSAQTKPSGAVLQPVLPAAPSTASTQSLEAAAQAPSGSATSEPASATTASTGTAHTTPASYTTTNPVNPLSAPAVASSPSPIMVQIAAISRPQDADVLISALQKRGFSATARRETSDNLLHVQIGPFATRQQAMAMRVRLVNDGYNAILK